MSRQTPHTTRIASVPSQMARPIAVPHAPTSSWIIPFCLSLVGGLALLVPLHLQLLHEEL